MFDPFITNFSEKTPKMKLTIKDRDGIQIGETCVTPAGFQLERFVESQFPTHVIHMSFPKHGEQREFHVKVLHDASPIRVYVGIYESSIE